MQRALATFLIHWSPYQFHNTAWHLTLGLLVALVLLTAGVPVRRALFLVLAYALLREFAWQYPFEDHLRLELADRLLDASEWLMGGTLAALFIEPLSQLLAWLAAAGGRLWRALLFRIFSLAGALHPLLPATPAAR